VRASSTCVDLPTDRDYVESVFGPRVTIESVSRESDELFTLSVSIGDAPPRLYRAWCRSEPGFVTAGTDEPLFFELSELSARRYADCGRYHLEITFLLDAVATGKPVSFPARLGATRFARPPSLWRYLLNHARQLVCRVIRRRVA
jgi:hypothetical protein